MAGDWIKIRTDLSDDPDVYRLSEILSLDCPTVVGHLVAFWGWMDRHTVDGKRLSLSDKVIDKRISLDGFAAALKEIGWLEGENGDLELPNFERHNGTSAKARALEAEAKRIRRADKNVGHESDKTTPKSPTRKEKRREEKTYRGFVPPSVDEVRTYCQQRGNSIDPESFVDFYQSKNWMIGKNKVKDWEACVRTWEKNRSDNKPESSRGLEL